MSESGKFGALTIDTQTIRKEAFRFDHGPLNLLRQFRNGPIRVVFATMVVKETTSHLGQAICALRVTLRRVIADSGRLLPQLVVLFDDEDL